jgi:hypothetical protein
MRYIAPYDMNFLVNGFVHAMHCARSFLATELVHTIDQRDTIKKLRRSTHT